MRILFIPHSRTIIPYHLFFGLSEIGADIYWCGKKEWWPPHQQPIPRGVAIRWRGRSFFRELCSDDIVLVPDCFQLAQEGIPQSKARLVILDTLDGPNINMKELSLCSSYFKCQLPRSPDKWLITDLKDHTCSLKDAPEDVATWFSTHRKKIYHFPYSTVGIELKTTMPNPGRDIFFAGWDSDGSSHRREVVLKLKDHFKDRFSGGLFKRGDLLDRDVPPGLIFPKIEPLNLYRSTAKDFKINLAPRSNGQLSFRFYELLSWGCFVLAERLDYPILPREPENHKHLVYFKSDLSDLVDLCNYYLENDSERKRIALEGYNFYWEHLSPKAIAKYFLNQLEIINADI